jgi:hypothetical protein
MNLSASFPIKAAAAALVLAAVAVYLLKKKGATNVAADATSTVLGVLGDVGAGVAIGIGDKIGVPRTNMTECEKAKAQGGIGGTWDASFACPAGDFLSYINPFR